MQWGVRAFNSWRSSKISDPNGFDVIIFDCDLNKLDSVMKFGLNYSLCRFIPEVTKCKDGSDYPGKTLYEIIVSIQWYLHQHDKPWKIIEDPEFLDAKTVLDNTMKERASNNIGMLKKQAQVITYDHENKLWADGILGEDGPSKLRDTVLFLLGIHLALRAGDEHYDLHRHSEEKPSQISFE